MKKIILIVLAWMLPAVMSAQTQAFKTFFDKFNGSYGYTTVEMSGDMLKMMSGNNNSAVNHGNNYFDNVDKIFIVVDESGSKKLSVSFDAVVKDGHYRSLSTVNSNGSSVKIFGLDGKDGLNEFLISATDTDNQVVLLIVGRINLNQASKLAKIQM